MALPTHGPFPAIGLYWFIDADPAIGPGLSAPLGQLAIRTDNDTLYVKNGPANTAWAALTGSAGGTIASDGVTITGDGSIGAPIEILAVQHDASLTGKGTVALPLSISAVTDGVTIEGNGSAGAPIEIKAVQHDLSISGKGTVAQPLSVVFPPVVTAQEFRYVAMMGDTDTIVIDAAKGFAPRASLNYDAWAFMGANAGGIGIVGCDPADYTLTQFVLRLTSAPTPGDSFFFNVRDLT